jgi:hypothetical protein
LPCSSFALLALALMVGIAGLDTTLMVTAISVSVTGKRKRFSGFRCFGRFRCFSHRWCSRHWQRSRICFRAPRFIPALALWGSTHDREDQAHTDQGRQSGLFGYKNLWLHTELPPSASIDIGPRLYY